MNLYNYNNALSKEFLNLLPARKGHFRFESGHHGNLWLDLDLLFLRPSVIKPFIVGLAKEINTYNVTTVCGPLVDGALIAQTIASELDLEFFYSERIVSRNSNGLYATKYRIPSHKSRALKGKKVAIVDDVMNAGSAVLGTLTELQAYGASPLVIGALLILGETAQSLLAEKNLPLRSVSFLPNKLWVPEKCPLCASQTPLEIF